MMPGIAMPNADKPYKRKNRIKHQVAIELGILILILLWESGRLREPVTCINPLEAGELRNSASSAKLMTWLQSGRIEPYGCYEPR
jgi:hypothetical protein